MMHSRMAEALAFLAEGMSQDTSREMALWLWLVLTVGLMGLVMIVTVILARARQPRHRKSKPSDMTDAWTEAGRKLQLPDEPSDDEDRVSDFE